MTEAGGDPGCATVTWFRWDKRGKKKINHKKNCSE